MGLTRALQQRRGRVPYVLAGSCGGCGNCCEAPALQVSRVTAFVPVVRHAFLLWQAHVNRWHLVSESRRSRVMTFRCDHFDAVTRRCGTYATRPGPCRDYPRNLMAQPWPEMLPGCGYRAVSKTGARLLRVLDAQDLSPEQREKLRVGLKLQ